MTKSTTGLRLLTIATIIGLTACGGGSGENNQQAGSGKLTNGAVTGPGTSYGTLTAFGSVFVNGVKYNTDNASIMLDDNPGLEADLQVGMVVKVEGHVNDDGVTGVAEKIEFHDELQGTVDTPPNLTTGTFVVMGQTVKFDNLTILADQVSGTSNLLVDAIGSIATGNVVEVSGWRVNNSSGVIHASWVKRKASVFAANGVSELAVKGVINQLDTTLMTFSLGGLTVNYGSATSVPSNLTNGMSVEVKSRQALSNTVMTASTIEAEDVTVSGAISMRTEIEGYITTISSVNEFSIINNTVKTSPNTVYENGTSADIKVGTKLQVKGIIDDAGILNASHVSIRLPNSIKIQALIDNIDHNAKIVTLMNNLDVSMVATTQFEDDSDAKLRPFSLSQLATGDFIEVRGYIKDGKVVAARLEREDAESEVLLQANVSEKANDLTSITLLGVSVNTTSAMVFRLQGDGPMVTKEAFFSALTPQSTTVKAKGNWNGASLIASEIEIATGIEDSSGVESETEQEND